MRLAHGWCDNMVGSPHHLINLYTGHRERANTTVIAQPAKKF